MSAKEQLLGIYRIQQLALAMRDVQQVVDGAPARIEEIEGRFRERNAAYVALKERYDELESDRRRRTGELQDLEERRKKFMDDLYQVKNQREYAAMLKEIDSVKAQISAHEDAVLSEMEELERLGRELAEHEEHIRKERELVANERAAVESAEAEARARLLRLGEERGKLEELLPSSLLATLSKLEQTRQGVFLSATIDGTCQSCFVRVRPQVFQEIKAASQIHTCSSCRRFLYFEATMQESAVPTGARREGVEAVDGGAV